MSEPMRSWYAGAMDGRRVFGLFLMALVAGCGSGTAHSRLDGALLDAAARDAANHPDSGGPADAGQTDAGHDDGGPTCSAVTGVDTAGRCAASCGAAATCHGLQPGDALESCQAVGHAAIQDVCDDTCQPIDDPDVICRQTGTFDCQGDTECDNVPAGTGACDAECHWDDPCDDPGQVDVFIDGVQIFFDEPAARSLICENMHFVAGWGCGSGPPGAQVNLITDVPGLFEADLINFQDDHQSCEEKWCFIRLQGACSEILLEKWNWNSCNTEHHTDQLKLEIWVDQNSDCSYDGFENWEPYGGHITWDPAHTYRVRIEYD